MNEIERVRMGVARVLHKALRQFEVERCPELFDMSVHIDQILSIKGLVILSDNQKLPEPCEWAALNGKLVPGARNIYKIAQQNMKEFRRIVNAEGL